MNRASINQWLTLVANFGVIAGLLLVVFEIRQNSDLMRAQISMERASNSIAYLTSAANGGEIGRIQAKLRREIPGYPQALGLAEVLTSDEYEHYRFWVIARSNELNNDWYQCSLGLIEEDRCRRMLLARIQNSIHRFFEFGIDYSRWPLEAIQDIQQFAGKDGLPALDDEGNWIVE